MADDKITQAEYPDIQGIVLNGYGHLTHSRYLFLHITDAPAARAWIRRVTPEIRTGERRSKVEDRRVFSMNLAVTYAGMQTLGLPGSALQAFPREYQEGMATGERPRVLGDTGDSAPDKWDVGGSADHQASLHMMLLIFATDQEGLDGNHERIKSGIDEAKIEVLYSQDTGRISNFEPFGYRDGISQPFLAGAPGEPIPGQTPINAGEFLLGYLNGYGTVPLTPLVNGADDPAGILPAAISSDSQTVGPGQRDFGRNGTYLIFRKLAQNVSGLDAFLDEHARDANGTVNETKKEWLGAKLVGRWKEGAPLVLAPDHNIPEFAEASKSDNFVFMPTDPDGLRCPIGAHVRRANPRDSLLPTPERSAVITNRHRIIRRGRHYHQSRPDTWNADGVEHGLCFIALNADIQRQFEFIQQTWINSPKFAGLFDCKCPLIGDNDGTGYMEIPADPVRQRLSGIPRFVRVRGGGYFFLPSMNALKYLSQDR